MQASEPVGEAPRTVELSVAAITAGAFAPYGTLLLPQEDGQPFGPDEARLELARHVRGLLD